MKQYLDELHKEVCRAMQGLLRTFEAKYHAEQLSQDGQDEMVSGRDSAAPTDALFN